jgi:hypothetical protein
MQADLDANTRDYRGDIEMVELLLSMYTWADAGF